VSAALHFWDVGCVETTYACGRDPEQPAICAIADGRLPKSVRAYARRRGACRQCLKVVRARQRKERRR
jgi:hypothetical protein